jgi:hypothetical protein
MNTSNHLLVLSQSDFIERQLGIAMVDAAASTSRPRGLSWRRLFQR